MSTSKPIQLQKLAMKPANPKILSKSLAGTSVFVSYPDPDREYFICFFDPDREYFICFFDPDREYFICFFDPVISNYIQIYTGSAYII